MSRQAEAEYFRFIVSVPQTAGKYPAVHFFARVPRNRRIGQKKGWKLSLDTYVYYGVVVKSDRYDLLINENVVLMNSHRFPFPQYVCSPDEKILEIAGQLESQK